VPIRPYSRDQVWLFPPSVEELLPMDHPARFVAEFVDALDPDECRRMKIELDGDVLGAPSYHPRLLLCVWLYGFLSGVRSSRKLELACKDQIPYMWLSGCQHPDHNTLWRFYEAHRQMMRRLLKQTIKTAMKLGLVDLAVQAVDGTKIAGNAAKDRTHDAKQLAKLLQKADEAIAELEAQNRGGEGESGSRLPEALSKANELREQVRKALEQVSDEEGPSQVNLTDGDARFMKSRAGMVIGYNAQAVVSPLEAEAAGRTGLLITAAEVVNEAADHGNLLPMLEAAEEMIETRAAVTLADGGYHSGENLAKCEEQGRTVLMPEAQGQALSSPYHKEHFQYDAQTDSYDCPMGHKLTYRGIKKHKGRLDVKLYRVKGKPCRNCPAFGQCTKDRRQGRSLEVGMYEDHLKRHREVMSQAESKLRYAKRKELVEPSFGILKEMQGARRLLLRGLANVQAEWTLLAVGFNLRTLWQVWRTWTSERQLAFSVAMRT
jgi:transposase